jgi:two-component system response regulator FixJ
MSETPLIAVVDDDEAIREALQSLLQSVGLRAEMFASAEDFGMPVSCRTQPA